MKSLQLYYLCVLAISLKISATHAQCDASKFECDNGNCISKNSLCDGVKNCPDGSDETSNLCVFLPCGEPYFRCSYGACIIGTAGCNGLEECADGSDETQLRCGSDDDKREFERKLQGNCQDDEIKCPSGICIDKIRNLCDGKDDCGDGYDESVVLCGHIKCPEYAFKCGSGGCIASPLTCNGEKDCFDGSDESWMLCNTTRHGGNAVATPVAAVGTPQDQLGCPLPPEDERPIIKDQINNRILTPPIIRAAVSFSCKSGYTLEGHEKSFCSNKKWSTDNIPRCMKYCESEGKLDGFSTKPTCKYNGQFVDCKQRYHAPGTTVSFACATGFYTLNTELPDMLCNKGGHWSRVREKCDQECGQIATPIQRFSAFGYSVNNTVVPWHVGIYSWHNEKNYDFKCGGTLLTPDLVITAAHCVFDEATRQPYDVKTFQIIASKFYRDYLRTTSEDRKRDVRYIKVPEDYKGRDDNYLKDLALVVLEEPLEFNSVIRPICIHFSKYAEKETINNNVTGKFTGWNFEGDGELQFVPAIAKMNSECYSSNLKDIQTDKFCIFTEGKALACRGDSGGGFTSRRLTSYSRDPYRHFLYGIISNAPTSDNCANDVTVLTNIQHFDDMISKELHLSLKSRA